MARRDTIRQARGCDTVGLRAGASSARALAAWPQWRRDTMFCIVIRGRPLGRDTARSSAVIRQHASATRPATWRSVRTAWGFCVAIQFLYRDRGAAIRRYSARARGNTTGGPCDTAPRRHDTSLSAPQHEAQCVACARLGRNVRVTWVPWVCSLCTQPSFDPVHCLQSLFGALFMDTSHEHCSWSFKK